MSRMSQNAVCRPRHTAVQVKLPITLEGERSLDGIPLWAEDNDGVADDEDTQLRGRPCRS